MPRGRYQQKQWNARQQAILEALETLSAKQGFASVTMDDLAEAVGISKATLYQHFDSKDAMLVHLMTQHSDRFIDWLVTTADQPPVERLRRVMHYLMEGHILPLRGLINLGREDVLPIFRSSAPLVRRHEQIIDLLAAIVRQGQTGGQIAPDLAPHVIISAMWALSNVSMARYESPGRSGHEAAQAAFADQMIALFERAIRPA
ncbi:MAG: TetR/AcrR family transcriptional regulator [Anaerolineae bacterium]|nr:TetR/AcrR family transcriptional regulator [Anaerolineae bacterium]